MNLLKLDHVNIFTTNLSKMVEWYETVLGMVKGDRPPFPVDGAWLYIGGSPVVHLSIVEAQTFCENPRLEHFAFTATGLQSFIDRLDARDIAFTTARVPGPGTLQVRLSDHDGNHLHVDFSKAEADALGL